MWGGEEQHKLTEEELPHLTGSAGRFHAFYTNFSSSGILSSTKYDSDMAGHYGDGDPSNLININIELGNDKPHNNLPPYYALAFIMKLKPGD